MLRVESCVAESLLQVIAGVVTDVVLPSLIAVNWASVTVRAIDERVVVRGRHLQTGFGPPPQLNSVLAVVLLPAGVGRSLLILLLMFHASSVMNFWLVADVSVWNGTKPAVVPATLASALSAAVGLPIGGSQG